METVIIVHIEGSDHMHKAHILDVQTGILVSIVCIVHCLAEPCLKMLLPDVVIPWTHGEPTRVILAATILFYGVAAIFQNELRHCNLNMRLVMVPGLILVAAAAFGGVNGMSDHTEIILLTVGNALVIMAHQLNRKLLCVHSALNCLSEETTGFNVPELRQEY